MIRIPDGELLFHGGKFGGILLLEASVKPPEVVPCFNSQPNGQDEAFQ